MSVFNIDKKLIFIHVPKTGGSSMEDTEELGTVITRHFGMDHYQTLVKDDPSLNLDEFFKFAFVRNPYDRVASGILNHPLKNPETTRNEFNEFIVKHKKMLSQWITVKPMHTFICIDGEIAVDFIGRFENIEEDWEKVAKKTGVNEKLEHKKRSDRSYDGWYNEQTREIVREYCKKDFELFNYTP